MGPRQQETQLKRKRKESGGDEKKVPRMASVHWA